MTPLIKIVILVIIVILLLLFLFKDNALKRNISLLWSLAIILILVIAIIILFSSITKDIGEGKGFLKPPPDEPTAPEQKTEAVENGVLWVEVYKSEINIGGDTYYSVSAVEPVLQEAKDNGAYKVHLVDNYALAEPYDELLQTVEKLFGKQFLEEEQMP